MQYISRQVVVVRREMREVTFKQKGLTYVSQLALENIQALTAIIQWNHEHGIRFFRYTLQPQHHICGLILLYNAARLLNSFT